MLIVVEGVSAAGKTTWCRQHAAAFTVPESTPRDDAPDPLQHPAAAALFWVGQHKRRWQAARAMEQSSGLAVCDTDPLKLHYPWSLWQVGAASQDYWHAASGATRAAIANEALGFAAIYLVKCIDPHLARQQRDADPTRSRRNFDLHIKLHDPLMAWYQALEQLMPGAIIWHFPVDGLASLPTRTTPTESHSLQIFDQLMATLAQLPPP